MKLTPLFVFNLVLFAVVLGFVINEFYLYIIGKISAQTIDAEEFQKGMRKAQVIDVREKDAFVGGHILGARNVPYTGFKQFHNSIRKDMPVYLYDHKRTLAVRSANVLRKNGYTDVYILKGGYNKWTGKIKHGN